MGHSPAGLARLIKSVEGWFDCYHMVLTPTTGDGDFGDDVATGFTANVYRGKTRPGKAKPLVGDFSAPISALNEITPWELSYLWEAIVPIKAVSLLLDLSGYSWKRDYLNTKNYVANDVVFYGGTSWRAKGTVVGIAPVEGADWTLLSDWKGPFSSATNYVLNNVVSVSGKYWLAKRAVSASATVPLEGADWTRIKDFQITDTNSANPTKPRLIGTAKLISQ